jgi:hypothetical protein
VLEIVREDAKADKAVAILTTRGDEARPCRQETTEIDCVHWLDPGFGHNGGDVPHWFVSTGLGSTTEES